MNSTGAARKRIPLALCWVCILASPHLLRAQITRPNGGPQPGSSQPGGPPPPAFGANSIGIVPDPRPDGAALRNMRVHAYQRMRQDSNALQALAAELDRKVNDNASGPDADAVKDARRIEKLAAEIDRLMRED